MSLTELTSEIRDAVAGTGEQAWPGTALEVLTRGGVWAHSVRTEYGGSGAAPVERLKVYESVAAGSLSVALILTQHDAACELLCDCENAACAGRLLPRCARGDVLLTVGISQLTTSRQGRGPAMRALADGNAYRWHGIIPPTW